MDVPCFLLCLILLIFWYTLSNYSCNTQKCIPHSESLDLIQDDITVEYFENFQQKPALVIKDTNDATLIFPSSIIDREMTYKTIDEYEIAYSFDPDVATRILDGFIKEGEWWGISDNSNEVSLSVRHDIEIFDMSCKAEIRPMSELTGGPLALPSNDGEEDYALVMTCPHNFRGNDETFWMVISNSIFLIAVAVQQNMRKFQ